MHTRLHVSVLCNDGLIPFIVFPRNVTGMMISNQDLPFLTRLAMPRTPACVTLHDLHSRLSFPERISSGINRIRQHAANVDIQREFPNQGTLPHRKCGQTDFLLSKPDQDLSHTSEFGHFDKDQLYRLLDALIGILYDLTLRCPTKTDGKR